MDIYEYGMQMEQESEKYYRDLAARCQDTGLNTILNMLADEEVRHYKILQSFREQQCSVPESDVLGKARDVFAQMTRNADFACGDAQIAFYEEAQKIERKSEEFYKAKAEEAETEAQKQALLTLAKAENKHYFLLENIIAFVQRPQRWLEDAEWNHLEEY